MAYSARWAAFPGIDDLPGGDTGTCAEMRACPAWGFFRWGNSVRGKPRTYRVNAGGGWILSMIGGRDLVRSAHGAGGRPPAQVPGLPRMGLFPLWQQRARQASHLPRQCWRWLDPVDDRWSGPRTIRARRRQAPTCVGAGLAPHGPFRCGNSVRGKPRTCRVNAGGGWILSMIGGRDLVRSAHGAGRRPPAQVRGLPRMGLSVVATAWEASRAPAVARPAVVTALINPLPDRRPWP